MELKDYCKLKGTNIKRVAEQANIPLSTLYTIASGKTPLDSVGISMFMKIAEVLEVPTDELYNVLKNDELIDDNTRYLTDDEITIMDNYRAISSYSRTGVLILFSTFNG